MQTSAPAEAKRRSLALFVTSLSSCSEESMNLDSELVSCLFLQLYVVGEVTEEAGRDGLDVLTIPWRG